LVMPQGDYKLNIIYLNINSIPFYFSMHWRVTLFKS
jgi:hypothetical protein